MTRETIMTALFNLLVGSGAFVTTGRRLQWPAQTPEQPAMFLRNTGEEYHPRATRMPAKVVMECEIWLYNKTSGDSTLTPSMGLNALLDAVVSALLPPPGFEAQTLGGLVTHCWIEGKIDTHPGDLDQQAIAIVPVKILVPTFGG